MVLVACRMERGRKDVLLDVLLHLLFENEAAVAGVEGLRKQEQATDAVPVFEEVRGLRELACMALGVVCPNVFDLVTRGTRTADVLYKTAWQPRLALHVVYHTCKQMVDVKAVLLMDAKVRAAGKGLRDLAELFPQGCGQ